MKQFKLVIEKNRGPAEHHGSDNLLELWEKAWWAFMDDEYPWSTKRVDFWVGEKKLRGSYMLRERFFRGLDHPTRGGEGFEGAYVPGWIWSQHEKGQVSLKQIKDWALSGCRRVAQDLKEEGKVEGFAEQLKKIEGVEKILGRKSHYYRR